MSKNKQKDTCLACNKAFTKSEASIQCVMCGLWIHHKPCSTISDEGFKFLCEQIQATGSAYWGCRACASYAQGITKRVREVEKKLDDIQKEVKENAKEIGRVDKSVEKLRNELEKVKDKQKEVSGVYITAEEYREREARRTNVIMHRVQEPEATTAEERKRADITECGNILQAVGLQEEKKEIKTCRRIGAKGEGPRPMVVVLNRETTKTAILMAASKLRNTRYKDVSIVPDLTQQQKARRSRTYNGGRKNEQRGENGRRQAKKLVMAGGGTKRREEDHKSQDKDRPTAERWPGDWQQQRGQCESASRPPSQWDAQPSRQQPGWSYCAQNYYLHRRGNADTAQPKQRRRTGRWWRGVEAEEEVEMDKTQEDEEEETGSPAHKK